MVKAYSYLRFSTPEQAKGDSERRQEELIQKYLETHPELTLDTELELNDKGVSAFRGANSDKGSLGLFLQKVREGEIKPGSYLLVENLDRLTRQATFDGLLLIFEIVTAGIKIVTLGDGKVITRESLDYRGIMDSGMSLSRAHEESQVKSDRVKKAWDEKKTGGIIKGEKLTKWSPKWLYLSDDRKSFLIDEERAKVVRKIFELSANGYGINLIVRALENQGIEPWDMGKDISLKKAGVDRSRMASKWHSSYIARLLDSRAVLGEYSMQSPKDPSVSITVPNYFPAIMDEGLFYRSKKAKKDRSSSGVGSSRGRKGKNCSNLFSGLVYCGYSFHNNDGGYKCKGDGEKMTLVNKGRNSSVYLRCIRAKNGSVGCEDVSKFWKYSYFERAFLSHVKDIDAGVIIGDTDEKNKELRHSKDNLEIMLGRRDEVERQLRQLEKDMDDALEEGRALPKMFYEKVATLESKKESITEGIGKLNEKLKSDMEEAKTICTQKDDLNILIDMMENMTGDELLEIRVRLQQLLKKVISRIDLFSVGRITSPEKLDKVRNLLGDEAADIVKEADKESGKTQFFRVNYVSGEVRTVMVDRKNPDNWILKLKTKEHSVIEDEIHWQKSP
jgi:DNA invertase Pin-like site-specific DNA recombinase/predicted nucleotidyltransferase